LVPADAPPGIGDTARRDQPGHSEQSRAVAAPARRIGARLRSNAGEAASLAAIFLLAVADRLVNLPARGIWDTDQGVETGAIWNAVVTRQLPAYGSPAFSTGGTFHHGALFYDLMMPAVWLGNGNPTVVVFVIALFGIAVVPMAWWTARSIGGRPAGLAAALLAAVSPSLIDYSTFVWNPVLVETGTALACLGAWQAWRTRQPRWWVVAAAGTALAAQSHLTGLVLVFPMAAVFALALRRGPSGERRRLLKWGLAGAGLFVLTWLPLIVYELGHDFAETRAMLAFDQPAPPAAGPLIQVFFGSMRIVVWPLMHWPLDNLQSGAVLAFVVFLAVVSGLVWRVGRTFQGRGAGDTAPGVDFERDGLRLVGGSLLFIALALSLGLKQISQVENVNQEQYHCVADVLVLLAAALVVGGLWRTVIAGRAWIGRSLALLGLVGLTVLCVSHWPPLTAPDGGWPAARAAADKIRTDAAGGSIAMVSLPDFKGPYAYSYPLTLDGVTWAAPDRAATVVILCDSGWYKGCGGAAEEQWRAAQAGGGSLLMVDRFEPAPGRILTVYRRTS
jgi:4-amino-4-deoxy-L-arabinose transferase-like glycosyltransferase